MNISCRRKWYSKDEWKQKFTHEEAEKWLNRLGNLTILGGPKNREVSNLPYYVKKALYRGEPIKVGKKKKTTIDIFVPTWDVANKYEDWTPDIIEARNKDLIDKIFQILLIKK
ncbi:unnamed protein product [marine sediment metagenome]|uniref:GmrSD restriction endonucleases C-terminal domain-containing protein n=1 Tax=marine sediment metagenome TaxID=412755 RepID=X1U3S3_9ZZZZ